MRRHIDTALVLAVAVVFLAVIGTPAADTSAACEESWCSEMFPSGCSCYREVVERTLENTFLPEATRALLCQEEPRKVIKCMAIVADGTPPIFECFDLPGNGNPGPDCLTPKSVTWLTVTGFEPYCLWHEGADQYVCGYDPNDPVDILFSYYSCDLCSM